MKKKFLGLLSLMILVVSIPVNALESESINEEEISVINDIDKEQTTQGIGEEVKKDDSLLEKESDTDTTIIYDEREDIITDNNSDSISSKKH